MKVATRESVWSFFMAALLASLGCRNSTDDSSTRSLSAPANSTLVLTRVGDAKGRIENPTPRVISDSRIIKEFCDAMREWDGKWKSLNGAKIALFCTYQIEYVCNSDSNQIAGDISENDDSSATLVGERGTLDLSADEVRRLKRILGIRAGG